MPFTVFYGLIGAIPYAWKDKIKRQNQTGKVNQNDNTTFNTILIYSSILESSFVPPTSQNRILHRGFTENNVHKVYQGETNNTQYSILNTQYSILNIKEKLTILKEIAVAKNDYKSFKVHGRSFS